jgi:hypothetical protein
MCGQSGDVKRLGNDCVGAGLGGGFMAIPDLQWCSQCKYRCAQGHYPELSTFCDNRAWTRAPDPLFRQWYPSLVQKAAQNDSNSPSSVVCGQHHAVKALTGANNYLLYFTLLYFTLSLLS